MPLFRIFVRTIIEEMLIRKDVKENYILGLWKIEEPSEELIAMLDEQEFSQLKAIAGISESRLLERVVTRILLANLLNQPKVSISYHPNGKPYLDTNELNISISHTKGYVAVILSKKEHLGIDIEYISERVKRVRSKFISESEFIEPQCEVLHLLLHWSAKETMYKAIGQDGVDLKENLHIEKFMPANEGVFCANETFTNKKLQFRIEYCVNDEYVLTYTI